MLEHSFSHIQGIGVKTEKILWDNNINNWNTFLNTKNFPLSENKVDFIRKEINKSENCIKNRNTKYFSEGLPSNQHWRLFKNFKNSIAYLDIETTGLYASSAIITTIAIYDGIDIKHYVNGRNLNDFKTDILDYNLLVTYNGKCFDIPFIEEYFDISLIHSHIDLRFVLHSLGYSGGLKGCEKQFGISRNNLEGIDGFFAIYLWEEYLQNKNEKALETLLAYNIEDVINLEYLMHKAYNLKLIETPFENELVMLIPNRPNIPFLPDLATIKKIKAQFYEPEYYSLNTEQKSAIWPSLKELF